MPTPSSGHDSRRKSGAASSNDAYKTSERREKSKSTQTYDDRRRGSRQTDAGRKVSERPPLKSRTNSAPLIDPSARYNAARGGQTELNGKEATVLTPPSIEVEDARDEDEVAGVVGTMKHFQPFQSSEIGQAVPDINIAVVGAEGVGKSTFVQNAFNLPDLPGSQAVERKLAIKGADYIVRLLELPIDDVDIDEDDTVSWPETIDDKLMPRIDGALTLYDIKNAASLSNVPKMLQAIIKTGIPSMLVSCKCDASPEEAEVDPAAIEQRARKVLKVPDTIQTSAGAPETHKRGLSIILRNILSAHSESQKRSLSANRQRAHSNAVRSVSPRPPSHTRAISELSAITNKEQRHSRHDSRDPGQQAKDRLNVPQETSSQDMTGSFLFEESSEASFDSSAEDGAPQAVSSTSLVPVSTEQGASFDELVDRLLAQPLSKADTKFAAIFLALYRKFAAPGRLLEAIVERFDALEKDDEAVLMKLTSQLRYMNIVEQWVGTYPGDFAFPRTKKRMRTFVGNLSKGGIFAAAANEINAGLDGVAEDDDTNWAFCDKDRDSRSGDSVWTSMSSTASKLIDDPNFSFGSGDFSLSGSTLLDDPSASRADSDPHPSTYSATLSSQLMANAVMAQKQAEVLVPIPRIPLSKVQWRLLWETPDDVVARELTRIDWTMFSSIRPRDLVRAVELNEDQKLQCKNLTHVDRMKDHFNHIAKWVANYVLLRDKPKHRALMLEKFMRIGRNLRQMNNYNSLGAIIAGIQKTEVHRLVATMDLVPPTVGKDWMKLDILMAPTRSYTSYRLAWENSSSHRIPFLPLHRRDLASAEQGNRTFVGDGPGSKINWKKFEVMGEVIVGLQKAQGMPYKGLAAGRVGEGVKELVLDVKLSNDEELWERSNQVEPTGSGAGSASTKFKEFFKR